ncbi:MAG: T9SS type A sorting domain-containing protein [Bacteroidetes bacterium]|nr:T9SS type A sorting domain-containing protein [Bacteroidota bacterium]
MQNIDNVTFTIGGSAALRNNFSGAAYGIKSLNSSLNIENNLFTNMVRDDDQYFKSNDGTAILASTTTTGNTIHIFGGNEFEDSPQAITFYGNIESEITGNSFSNLLRGININNNASALNNIYDNTFTSVSTAVIGRNITGNFQVYNNSFENTVPATISSMPYSSFNSTAVTIQNSGIFTTGDIHVFSNGITNYRIGIHALNIPGIVIGGYDNGTPPAPTPNTINFNVNDGSGITNIYSGIWLQHSDYAVLKENFITNNALITTNPELIRGIVANNSLSLNICGNTVENLGFAMQFEGDCQLSELKNNSIIDYYTGINYIDAKFTAQGTSSTPWDNTWTQTVINTSLYKVDGNLDPPAAFDWSFQGANVTSGNDYSPNPYNGAVVIPDPGATPNSIDCEAETLLVANIDRDLVYGPVVADTITYSENQDNYRYLARASLFNLLSDNPGLITISSPFDSAFAAFYNEMRLENTGKFDSVRLDINSNQLVAADVRNEAIDDDNAIESNIKAINNIQINKIVLDIDLDDADSTVLETIFEQHWKNGGLSVYDAAAILFKEYYSTGYSLREQTAMMELIKPIVVKKDLGVYPNPAKGKIYFDRILAPTSIIRLFDASGRLIVTGTSSYELDINGVEDGFYVLKVYENQTDVFIKNVVIIN